ncbi:MAG: helix-turn-helix transcriptional regulator [Gammaproteobacteria bacterium]|nr:helix-turn-helix transcriptional regulator [Gammaproteobacteria bacterium]
MDVESKSIAELWKDVACHQGISPAELLAVGEEYAALQVTPLRRRCYLIKWQERPIYLTQRELEALRLLKRGLTNVEMALELGVSSRTIEYFIKNLRLLFSCHTKADLIRLVHNQDILVGIKFCAPAAKV